MGNSLLTISMITKETTRVLKNNLGFAKSVNRQYDDSFAQSGAKIGSVINVRKPVRFAVTTGPALSIQDVQDQSVALTLSTQAHVDFQFTSKDLTLSVDEFSTRLIKPATNALVNKVDFDGLALANSVVSNSVGVPATTPATALVWLQAGQKLDENACPRDDMRTLCMNPAAQALTVSGLSGLFQSSEKIGEQYASGVMGKSLGFTWKMDQNVQSHTVGALGGTPITTSSGSPQTGASITMQGGSNNITNYFTVGDVITFAGVFNVNPVNFQSTGALKQFVVTANVSTNGSGVATIPISPAIVTSGPYQTVSVAPATSAAIQTFGSVSTSAAAVTPGNLAFHRDAFVLGMADLDVPRGTDMAARVSDPDSGISLRMVRSYDIVNDIFPCRMDILYGYVAVYPEWACRVQG